MRPPRTQTRPTRRSQIPGPRARALCAALALAMAWSAAGCRLGGPRNFENENDRLRRVVLELEDDIRLLQADRAELRAKLDEARRDRSEALPEEVLDALPRVASVEISRLSGIDTAYDGSPLAVVHVRTLDGRRRFVHAVGTLRIEALALPPGLAADTSKADHESARVLARTTLGPTALREMYVGGFAGPTYTIELPFTPVDWDRKHAGAASSDGEGDSESASASAQSGEHAAGSANDQLLPVGTTLVLRIEFEDAITGRTHRAERLRSLGQVERIGPTPSRMRRPDE